MTRLFAYIAPETSKLRSGSNLVHTVFALWSAISLACSEPASSADPSPTPGGAESVSSASASATTSAVTSGNPAENQPRRQGGGRGDGSGGGKRFGEATTYVDGVPRGVLRYYELPAKLKSFDHKLLDGNTVPRFRFAEYLTALGVKLDDIREVHLVGGRNRAAIISGSEFRRHRETLAFSFSRGDGGKARVHWPPTKIEVNTTIDTVVNMLVYVERTPATYDKIKRRFVDENGKEFEGVPYAKPEDAVRGTRVYLDGALAGSVKRKRLPDSVLSPRYTLQDPVFSLDKFLGSVGVEDRRVREVDVISGDLLVARWSAADWSRLREKLDFALLQGSESRIDVRVSGTDQRLPASAILVFAGSTPRPELAKAKITPVEPGSMTPQPDPEESAE